MFFLRFRIANLVLRLAGKTDYFPEYNGSIHVYFSSDLGAVECPPQHPIRVLEIDVPSCVGHLYTFSLPKALESRRNSCVVFNLYANSEYEHEPYLVPCGARAIPLKELVAGILHVQIMDQHSRVPLNKCSFDLVVEDIKTDIALNMNHIEWIFDTDHIRFMQSYCDRSLNLFFDTKEANYKQCQRLKPSKPGLQAIHCPYYKMEIDGGFLPGFAYANIMPNDPPNEDFYLLILRNSLTMYEITEQSFTDVIDGQLQNSTSTTIDKLFNVALCVIAETCSMYSQGMLYVPDHVNNSNTIEYVENMSNVRITHGNDCEDMNQDAIIVARTLKEYCGWQHPLLKRCKLVLDQFVMMLAHGGVVSESASTLSSNSNNSHEFVTHIFCLFLPVERFKTMLERTKSDKSFVGEEYCSRIYPPWNINLDVLICEGTGVVSPILRPEWEWRTATPFQFCADAASKQIEFEEKNPHFLDVPIMQKPYDTTSSDLENFHPFYRYVVGAYLPILSFPTSSSSLLTLPKVVGDISFVYSLCNTYGINIYDFVYDTNCPGIVYNEICSEDEIACIADALKCTHPIPQLTPRSEHLMYSDKLFLTKELGLAEWTFSDAIHFGYFINMRELRKNSNFLSLHGNYKCSFKYFGLDETAAFVELCIYPFS